jgi:hypothetical protein
VCELARSVKPSSDGFVRLGAIAEIQELPLGAKTTPAIEL